MRDFVGEYRRSAHSICNLKYSVPQKIPITFHNRSNYDYHFIMKEFAEKFKKQFTCLGEHWKIHNLYSPNRERSYKYW